jgi:hypothetical protein
MQDLSDKDLDQFFKDSDRNHHVSFEEASWLKLESKLERNSKRRVIIRSSVAIGFVLLLTGSLYLGKNLYWIDTETQISDKYIMDIKTIRKKNNKVARKNLFKDTVLEMTFDQENKRLFFLYNSDLEKITSTSNPKIFKEKEGVFKKEHGTLGVKPDLLEKKYGITINHYDHRKAPRVNKVTFDSLMNTRPEPQIGYLHTNPFGEYEKNVSIKDAAFFQKVTGHFMTGEEVNKEISIIPDSKDLEKLIEIPQKEDVMNRSVSDSVIEVSVKDSLLINAKTAATLSEKVNSNKSRFRRFSIGILATPDLTTVGFSKLIKPGIAAGLICEYHLGNRWSIQTGFIRSSKIYSSRGGYHSTEGYWVNKNNTDRIDGSCMVIDVPVNVKYHFLQGPENLMFISTGLSSYFMNDERYSFIYKSNNSERTWYSENWNKYYFGIINFSIGYERYINKVFSVQAEPFIKIPMKGIGDGKAKLLTTGAFFSLKYTFRQNLQK